MSPAATSAKATTGTPATASPMPATTSAADAPMPTSLDIQSPRKYFADYGRESRLTPSGGRTGSTPFYRYGPAMENVSVTLRVIVDGTRHVWRLCEPTT